MPDDDFEGAVDAAAATYELSISDEERAGYAVELELTADLLADVEPTRYRSERADDVRRVDDEYNAFLYRCDLASGTDGPLAGVQIAVKDNIAVAGVPMTCGSAALDFEPDYSATVTERLLAGGADVVGTTNMDEFAYSTTGETCAHGRIENPSADGVPGGSSSGSGAAVAAELADAALGTDTGGSIRIPASFCGVVGLKPTFRTVPRFGFADLAPSLDHVGPLAPDVATAARVLEAINGPDRRDPSTHGMRTPAPTAGLESDVDGRSVGLVREAQDGADDEVAAAIEAAADRLAAAGVSVEEVSLPAFDAQPLVNAAVTATEFSTLIAQAGQDYGVGTGYSEAWRAAVASLDTGALGENVRGRLVVGRALTQADRGAGYVAARNARHEFDAAVDDRLATYDALVLPTTPMTAPAFGAVSEDADVLRTIAHTSPFNLTGHPALSVPLEAGGDPIGCQLVADWYDEATAVALGATVEAAG